MLGGSVSLPGPPEALLIFLAGPSKVGNPPYFDGKKWKRAALVCIGMMKQFMHDWGVSLANIASWWPKHNTQLSWPSSRGMAIY